MTRRDRSRALQSEVVDAAIDAYVHWRDACADTCEAYDGWSSANRADRTLAASAYWAALDREETAANGYAIAMRRLKAECKDGPFGDPCRVANGTRGGRQRKEGSNCALR